MKIKLKLLLLAFTFFLSVKSSYAQTSVTIYSTVNANITYCMSFDNSVYQSYTLNPSSSLTFDLLGHTSCYIKIPTYDGNGQIINSVTYQIYNGKQYQIYFNTALQRWDLLET